MLATINYTDPNSLYFIRNFIIITHSNTIGYNRSTKQANDQHKRSPNYNQSMNRKKEASPTITTGNQSSRTIKEDDELIRNAVSGPFA